jgi:hypothetical protein
MAADPWNSGAQIHQTAAQPRDSTGQCAERNLGGGDSVNLNPANAAQHTATHSFRHVF